MSVRNLEGLFHPRSVAVIGASERPGSVGAVVLANLLAGGFKGPIWPVNRAHATVDGKPAWHDVESLPQAPDLAVICTPAATVPALMEQLARKGTRAAIVITSGLKQSAGEGQATLERQMLDAARPQLLRVLGPNCIGALSPAIGLNASFAPGNARAGGLAFVTQSGALATAMLDWAGSRGIGFSHFISLGDCADVDFGDVLDYLASDPRTRAILMYMESVSAARKFMSAARAASRNKPVIVVKAGRAPDGARAAASHTGALAGSDAVFDAAVRRAGMLRVGTLEALFDAAQTLAHSHPWKGERLAILTNGGGAAVLAADALDLGGGALAPLAADTLAALDACLPATWSRGNPVDIIGDAPVSRYCDALRVLLAAREVDGVLFIHAPTAIVPASDIAHACLPLLAKARKPVLASWLGGLAVASARGAFAQAGIACYETPERATDAWLQLAAFARNQAALQELAPAALEDFRPDRAGAQALLAAALAEGREWLDGEESMALLRAYGIATAPSRHALDEAGAIAAADAVGYPVALKVMSHQIVHKSDVGGVELGITTAQELAQAMARMRQRVAALQPLARIEGFIVQGMVQREGGRELIAGIATDPVFGPVLLFGEGGTAVELRRHAVALPPLNDALARELVTVSGAAPLLGAHRGHAAVHEAALLGALRKVSQMACDLNALAELDINPLVADANGVVALDARVRLRTPAPGETSRLAVRAYPGYLEERMTIDGCALLVRPIRPEDGEKLADFYSHATESDLRLRFFMSRRDVPRSELARYSQIDYDREMTFVAMEAQADGSESIAGQACGLCDPDNYKAEFAIQVATGWQRRGLGEALLGKLANYMRQRGTIELEGECLRENTAVAQLSRRVGFTVGPGSSGASFTMKMALQEH